MMITRTICKNILYWNLFNIKDGIIDLRNKSWKPECVESFMMDLRILVFYPEPEARDKIY